MRSLSHKTAAAKAGYWRTAFYLDETPKHAFSTIKKMRSLSYKIAAPEWAKNGGIFAKSLSKKQLPPWASQPGRWGVGGGGGGWWWLVGKTFGFDFVDVELCFRATFSSTWHASRSCLRPI